MPNFYLKRESKIYLVYAGLKYDLAVVDFSASQTFDETTVKRRTLHDFYHRFDAAVIKKANPLNFDLTVPLMLQTDNQILTDLLLGYNSSTTRSNLNSFDLFIQNGTDIWKLEKCVFENGIFQVSKDSILLLNLSGTGSKFASFSGAIPGTLQTRTTNPTYIAPTKLEVTINSVIQADVTSVNLEFKNNVEWVENKTVHSALNVVTATDTIYPQNYQLISRDLTGTVQEYLTSDFVTDQQNWGTAVPITVKIGDLTNGYILTFTLPQAVITNRSSIEELFTRTFDIRLANSYITDLTTVVDYH